MNSIKKETFKQLNRMKPGTRFQSDEFSKYMQRVTGEYHQVGTYLRYLREYRMMTGRKIKNVDKKNK